MCWGTPDAPQRTCKPAAPGGSAGPEVSVDVMRIGKSVEIRPLGGAWGCLAMILVSVVLSILLTVVLNLLLR